jgi:hypothetical protein
MGRDDVEHDARWTDATRGCARLERGVNVQWDIDEHWALDHRQHRGKRGCAVPVRGCADFCAQLAQAIRMARHNEPARAGWES